MRQDDTVSAPERQVDLSVVHDAADSSGSAKAAGMSLFFDWRDWSLCKVVERWPDGTNKLTNALFALRCSCCRKFSAGCRDHWLCGCCEQCRSEIELEE
jgi:hypothetical protein